MDEFDKWIRTYAKQTGKVFSQIDVGIMKAAVLAEREACAMVCDAEAEFWRNPKYSYAAAVGEHCSKKIRGRANG